MKLLDNVSREKQKSTRAIYTHIVTFILKWLAKFKSCIHRFISVEKSMMKSVISAVIV